MDIDLTSNSDIYDVDLWGHRRSSDGKGAIFALIDCDTMYIFLPYKWCDWLIQARVFHMTSYMLDVH